MDELPLTFRGPLVLWLITVVWAQTALRLGRENMGLTTDGSFHEIDDAYAYATLQAEPEPVMMMQEKPRIWLTEQISSIGLARAFRSARSSSMKILR